MKSKFFFTLLLCFSLVASFSQGLVDEYKKGEIVLNDGSKIEGYIFYSFEHVSSFQNSVSYIDQATYDNLVATGKVKMKNVEKLSPKEVKYYMLADGTKYVPETYADLTAAGTGSIPKKIFLEQIIDGKIKLYKKYQPLEGLVSGADATLAMQGGNELAERNRNSFELLVIKDTKNVKQLANIKLVDYISDNPAILEKFNADEYGELRTAFASKLKWGFDEQNHIADLVRLIVDYNKG